MIQYGTFFVAAFFKDYAVVAVDRRELSGEHIDDRYCKIRPLWRNAFFLARGATSATDKATGAKIFDARNVAHSLYVQSGVGTTKFDELAEAWALKMTNIYNTRPAEYGLAAVDGIMTDGFFVGLDESGSVGFAGRRIKFQPQGLARFPVTREPIDYTDPAIGPRYVSGYFQLMDEFKNGGQTERAERSSSNSVGFPPDQMG